MNEEYALWDEYLNKAYRALRDHYVRDDGALLAEEALVVSKTEALRDMQRAWIEYRDRLCELERARWGGGTGGGPAQLACLMHETARQYFNLTAEIEMAGL